MPQASSTARGDVVLGRDHPQLLVLALRLVLDQAGQLRIGGGQVGDRRYVHERLQAVLFTGTQARGALARGRSPVVGSTLLRQSRVHPSSYRAGGAFNP